MSGCTEPGVAERPAADCSYLLRIRVRLDGTRYMVQDLKTGERHAFDGEAQRRRFIAEHGARGLR